MKSFKRAIAVVILSLPLSASAEQIFLVGLIDGFALPSDSFDPDGA